MKKTYKIYKIMISIFLFALIIETFRYVNISHLRYIKHLKCLTCDSNLKNIGLALHNYNSTYGCLPPAYVADNKGRPMHSWRVLLLASMGYPARSTYDAYNFNEPWDGPNNQKLASQMNSIYACPNHGDRAEKFLTSYVAFVGPQAAFTGKTPTSLNSIIKINPRTIMLCEIDNIEIKWMEPKDINLEYENLRRGNSVNCFSSKDDEGPGFLFADGSLTRFKGKFLTNFKP